ncbi:cell division cycle and apoptosis regulator protein 1 [Tanacetum coccineum]
MPSDSHQTKRSKMSYATEETNGSGVVWRGMAEIGIIYTEDQNVYSFNLLDIERDYLSMDRRYTRLYVSPECAKVVVNWSREDLNIPLKTPITFKCS